MVKRVGHFAPWLLAALVAALIVLTLLPADLVPVAWPILLLVLVGAVLLGVSVLVHNRRLCERCIAALPLDASRVASRYRHRFRVAHLFERKLFAVCYLVVLLGSALLYSNPVGRYAWAVVQGSIIYLLLVYVTHQRLQPWCPHCRNGGTELTAPAAPTPLSTGG